jgi:tetratricopeptide (TPR) repeat protein
MDDLSTARRFALHRAAAHALERLPDPERARRAAELAHHLLWAGDGAAALPYLLRAGDHAASVYAHAEAQRHYELAIRLAATHHDKRSRAAARVRLGHLLTITGRLDDGRQQLEEAVADFRAVAEDDGLARAELALAINLGLSARVEEALSHLLSVRDLIEPTAPPGELALVEHWLSNAYLLISGHGEELLAAERARDYARRASEPLGIARAQMRFGSALIRQGHIEEGCSIVERYLALAPQIGDVTDYGAVLWTLIEAYTALGHFAGAYRYLEEAERLAKDSGHSIGEAGSAWLRGALAFYEGAWEKCYAIWVEAVEMTRAAQLPHFPYYLLLLGHLCYLRGDRTRATDLQGQALALIEQRSRLWFSWACLAALAEQDLLAGAPAAAARRLELALAPLPDALHLDALRLLPPLAHAYLELGREVEAESVVGRALERAASMNHRLVLVDALRVQALLAMRRRAWGKAEAALEESLELARTLPYPYAEAKALHAYGALDTARGESALAREQYALALAIYDHLGEGPYRSQAARALAESAPPSAMP